MTNTKASVRSFYAALVFGAVLALGLFVANSESIVAVDAPLDGVVSTSWDCLLSAGYVGSPDDSAERLYVTVSDVVECSVM